MKILVYFNSIAAAGGIERVIARHVGFMCEAHHVALVTKDELPSFYPLPAGVRRVSLHVDFMMDMKSRWKRIAKIVSSMSGTILALRRHIKESKPDVVYVASPLNLLEVIIAGVKWKQIVITEHSSFSAYNSIYKIIALLFYKAVGLLIVPTTLDSEYYFKIGIKNKYLPNPLSFYPDESADLSRLRAICVGRLTADKRHDLLLDIWKAADIHGLGWRLSIFGKGECEAHLRAKIASLGLEESVFIEPPTQSIQSELIASSIFLLTSRAEGFGLVLTEAMACGVPCISFDCPSGPRDIIQDRVTGRLVRDGDVAGFVTALREIAIDMSLRQRLGKESRLAVQKFHSDKVGPEFLRFLSENFIEGTK